MEPRTWATFHKFNTLRETVSNLRVRDKRSIYLIMRTTPDLTCNTFFPNYGFTAGEFAVGQILAENNRGPKSKETKVTKKRKSPEKSIIIETKKENKKLKETKENKENKEPESLKTRKPRKPKTLKVQESK